MRGKYRDVILPMTVIRRLDAVLEPTQPAVLQMKQQLDQIGVTNLESLRGMAGQAFYNASPFMLKDLTARTRQHRLVDDFAAYLDGFSPNVQDILEKFGFRNQIPTLARADALRSLIGKFVDTTINLGPDPVLNADPESDASVRLHALQSAVRQELEE